ncbi:MAG: helix-hairpin-helix domain-containing protein, partial [Acidimicrobiia bacterium]|nr:helix-hairpin-helix domain-containing protein [Acidimicrobiia bacterium]
LSFVVGIATLLWAMRDRFISLALPREPRPPAFRHPDEHPVVPHRPHANAPTPARQQPSVGALPDNLEDINGIGAVFARKLAESGISTFAELAAASADEVAENLNTGSSRVADWIGQARARL